MQWQFQVNVWGDVAAGTMVEGRFPFEQCPKPESYFLSETKMLTVAYVFQAFAYNMTLLLFLLTPLTPANPHKRKATCFESPRKKTMHTACQSLVLKRGPLGKTNTTNRSELGFRVGHPTKTHTNNRSELGVEAVPPRKTLTMLCALDP